MSKAETKVTNAIDAGKLPKKSDYIQALKENGLLNEYDTEKLKIVSDYIDSHPDLFDLEV